MNPRAELAAALAECVQESCMGEKITVGGVDYLGFFGSPQIGLEYIPGRTLRKVEFTVLIPKSQLPLKPDENTLCEGRGQSVRVAKTDDAHPSWRLHLTTAKA